MLYRRATSNAYSAYSSIEHMGIISLRSAHWRPFGKLAGFCTNDRSSFCIFIILVLYFYSVGPHREIKGITTDLLKLIRGA